MLSAKAKSKADARRFFMLMGGAVAAVVVIPPGGDCDPYTRPAYTAANVNLDAALERVAYTAANINLCEEMT